MQNNLVETLVGAAVIGVAVLFLTFAYQGSDRGPSGDTYEITARVTNIAGVSVGTDVRIAGIKIGTVSDLNLDDTTYEAILTLSIGQDYELAEDTSLSVASESLLGGNYVTLQPGGDFENPLQDGDEILFATGTVDLLSLVQQAIFGSGSAGGSGGSDASSGGGSSAEDPFGDLGGL